MKKVLFTLVAIATFGAVNAQNVNLNDTVSMESERSQFEITVGGVNAAVADAYGNTIEVFGGQVNLAYDFAPGKFKAALEVDLNYAGNAFGFLPGIQIGHDNIYALVSYNTELSTPYAGLGGRIDFSDSIALSLGLQAGQVDVTDGYDVETLGIGYANVGITFKL